MVSKTAYMRFTTQNLKINQLGVPNCSASHLVSFSFESASRNNEYHVSKMSNSEQIGLEMKNFKTQKLEPRWRASSTGFIIFRLVFSARGFRVFFLHHDDLFVAVHIPHLQFFHLKLFPEHATAYQDACGQKENSHHTQEGKRNGVISYCTGTWSSTIATKQRGATSKCSPG